MTGSGDKRDGTRVAPARQAESLLAQCPVPAALIGRDGEIVDVNPAARALLPADPWTERSDLHAFLTEHAVSARHGQGLVSVPGSADGGAPRTVALTLLPVGLPGLRLLLLHDVTLETNLRAALGESRQRYRDLVEISSDFAWEVGPDGTFAFVSPRGALGYAAADLVGRRPAALMIDPPTGEPVLPFATREPLDGYEVWVRDAAGAPACLLTSCQPLADVSGRWLGARGVCRDVTAERARDAALAEARNRERLMAYVLRSIGDVPDPAVVLPAAARAVARALDATGCLIAPAQGGTAAAARSGALPDMLPDPQGAGSTPVEVADRDGMWLAVATRFGGARSGAIWLWRAGEAEPWSEADRAFLADIAGHVAVVIEQAAQYRELQRLSSTDALTGLDNRRAFFAALERRLARDGAGAAGGRAGDRAPGALVYVDVDNFKQVNDRCGHARGDEALNAVAAALRANSRAGDRVARLGGDEFALWLEATDAAGADVKARALLAATAALAPFSPDEAPPLGFSIGIAIHDPAAPEDLAALVARADEAMYVVKHAGKGAFRIAPAPANAGEEPRAVAGGGGGGVP